jgi:protein-S-isoprenylcysteine O-methyltransferase Ste14
VSDLPTALRLAPAVVFFRLTLGAARAFTPHPSAFRDIRSRLIVLSFWAISAAAIPTPFAPAWLMGLGVIGFVGALVLFQWAAHSIRGRHFSYIFSTDEPQFLHTAGPYAHIRNPAYASYLLAFLSTALMFPSVLTVGLTVGMAAYFQIAARFEEGKFEASPLREEYLAYKARTGRLLPRL